MRLLDAKTLQFKVFWFNPPDYAILSHTWLDEAEEPTCQDIENGTRKETKGYRKLEACCKQAIEDGYEYVWADTCCIDKTNSVELQGAINSMFNWYEASKICYAYLADYHVPAGSPVEKEEEEFEKSKWFTRGWTLQELIAPESLRFYSWDWRNIGSKIDRCALISKITRISPQVLAGDKNALEKSSIAQRMSWASKRETTRPEDIA